MRNARKSFDRRLNTSEPPRPDTRLLSNLQLELLRRETEARNEWFVQRRMLETPWTLKALRATQPEAKVLTSNRVPWQSTLRDVRVFNPNMVGIDNLIFDPSTGEIAEHSRIEQNKKDYREASSPCHVAKETRRHMIIQSGHGGRNGFTQYRKHEEC